MLHVCCILGLSLAEVSLAMNKDSRKRTCEIMCRNDVNMSSLGDVRLSAKIFIVCSTLPSSQGKSIKDSMWKCKGLCGGGTPRGKKQIGFLVSVPMKLACFLIVYQL